METARKTFIQIGVVVGTLLLLYLLYLSRSAVLLVVISIILAVSIYPLIEKLEKRDISRAFGGTIVMLIIVAIIFLVISLIAKPLIVEGTSLVQNLPDITERVTNNPTFKNIATKYNVAESLNNLSSNASSYILGGGTSFVSVASHVFQGITSSVVVLVLTFLFLIEGEDIWRSALHFLRPSDRATARKVGFQIKRAIGGFISGNLFISLIAGVVTAITLFILHVPYVLALSALVALLDLIPLIGAAIATIAVGFVALTEGVSVAVIAIGILLIYQFIEGHFIQPLVYSRSIDLSPLFIVLVSIIGAEIAGITGVLLAIPVGAILQIVTKEMYMHFIVKE